MEKKTVAVLFGGVSSEHDVSVVSAVSVIEHIPREKYDLVLVGITKEGKWMQYHGSTEKLPDDSWQDDPENVPAFFAPDPTVGGLLLLTDPVRRIPVDVIFPVLHGKNGEDGTMQGLFQMAQIPFVGCDALASAACMDKEITNALADAAKIPQARWLPVTRLEFSGNPEICLDRAEEKLGYPIFVKPACAGSSVGITKAPDRDALRKGLETAFREDKKAVLEETVSGREVECAVRGNRVPIVGEVGEIVPCNEFYDYEAKYENPASQLHIPARLPLEKREEVARLAVQAYQALGCEGMARVDFFVTEPEGRVLLNEINTIPGFTSISMYPKLFAAKGVAYGELLDHLLELALERGGTLS